MKVKSNPPKEDPETKARRQVEEARAEADRTSALQGLLDRRQRRVMRVFGKDSSGGNSGASGVPSMAAARAAFGGESGGTFGGPDAFGNFNPGVRIFEY